MITDSDGEEQVDVSDVGGKGGGEDDGAGGDNDKMGCRRCWSCLCTDE